MATIAIHDDANELVFASDPDDPICAIEVPEGGGIVRFHFPEVPLLDGTYSVSVGVRSATDTAIFDWKDQVTQFEVANPGRSTGRVRLPLDMSFRLRSPGTPARFPRSVPSSRPRRLGRVHLVIDLTAAVTRIDQVIPTLASRDAIGGHVMQLRDLLRSRGYHSDIYYGNATADRLDDGYPDHPSGRPTDPGRVLLYQLSIGSGVADIFRDRPERKFVNYHNITPADLLEAWIPEVGEEVRWGRAQLRDLAPVTEFAIADSPSTSGSSGRRLPVDHDHPAAHRPGGLRRFARPGPLGTPGRPEGRRCRPVVRGQGLAPQGPARPGQGPGCLPSALRPRGPAPHGGGRDQRRLPAGRRAVRRRAGLADAVEFAGW